MKRSASQEPRHVTKLRDLLSTRELSFKPGTVTQLRVAHDDWCGVFKGRACDCDPDIDVVRQNDEVRS